MLLLLGCSDKGARLNGQVLSPTSTSASLTTGNGGTCTSAPCDGTNGTAWNDSFITPNGRGSFTIAIKSATLIQEDDTTAYTIVDTGNISNPTIISFTPGSTQQIATNASAPPDGTYTKIQYVLSYIEMMIPINYQNTGSQQRRVRLYLASYNDTTLGQAVAKNDILFDNTSGSLNWIDPDGGLGTFISTKGTFKVLQLPFDDTDPTNRPNQLANADTNGGTVDDPAADPYTFTVFLDSPAVVSGDNKFDFQLNFDIAKIFFFDETNGSGITDPVASATNVNFNAPLNACTTVNSFTNIPCDGRLDAKPKAYFWPGLPAVTASGPGGGSGTTTTTTTSTTTTT